MLFILDLNIPQEDAFIQISCRIIYMYSIIKQIAKFSALLQILTNIAFE